MDLHLHLGVVRTRLSQPENRRPRTQSYTGMSSHDRRMSSSSTATSSTAVSAATGPTPPTSTAPFGRSCRCGLRTPQPPAPPARRSARGPSSACRNWPFFLAKSSAAASILAELRPSIGQSPSRGSALVPHSLPRTTYGLNASIIASDSTCRSVIPFDVSTIVTSGPAASHAANVAKNPVALRPGERLDRHQDGRPDTGSRGTPRGHTRASRRPGGRTLGPRGRT